MEYVEVWPQPEKYKEGWVAGFYDARADDGLRYLDDILRYGPRTCDEQSYLAGYRAGRQARRGAEASYSEPALVSFRPAA